MNNRRRLKIKTWLMLRYREFRKMTPEQQQEKLDKFWDTFITRQTLFHPYTCGRCGKELLKKQPLCEECEKEVFK